MFGEEVAAAGPGSAVRAAAEAAARTGWVERQPRPGGGAAAVTETVPMAVVAVAGRDGLARVFRIVGVAAVVRAVRAPIPSTASLLDAWEKIHADEILLLPTTRTWVLAARQAAELANRRVRVVADPERRRGLRRAAGDGPGARRHGHAEFMTLAGAGRADPAG